MSENRKPHRGSPLFDNLPQMEHNFMKITGPFGLNQVVDSVEKHKQKEIDFQKKIEQKAVRKELKKQEEIKKLE